MTDAAIEFFLVVTPGLEELAATELKLKWARLHKADAETFAESPAFTVEKGGLSLKTSPAAGWLLNSYLKIPTRILQRVDRFTAKDFPKLYNRLKKFPWNKFFRSGAVEIKVAVSASRLKIKDRIRETALKAIADAQTHQAFRKPYLEVPQTVFLRIQEDEASVSVDTSGDALYLRGYKPQSVVAPLRETLAAALYLAAYERLKTDPAFVVDPMCGSGTLIFESFAFWKPNTHRRYACQNFPYAPELMTADFKALPEAGGPRLGLGLDHDEKAHAAAVENAKVFGVPEIQFVKAEINDDAISDRGRPALMLVNPPYNERIKADASDIRKKLEAFATQLAPDVACVVWPGERAVKSLAGRPLLREIHTTSGGLPITMALY
ncbi:MAG TPA: hypothetical protein VFV50_08475 [Bdellovibrionales bacterium]|nr:hypothetical protein [Bdellovibrionales bacterium]